MGTELEKMRENLNKNYSLKVRKLDCNLIKFLFPFQDPPNPSYGSFFNVYLFHESDKGAGMFTEYYQGDGSKPMPFIVLDDHYLVKQLLINTSVSKIFIKQQNIDGYIDYRMIAHELHHAYVWERTFDSPGMSGQGAGKLE